MKRRCTILTFALMLFVMNHPIMAQYPGKGQVPLDPGSVPKFVDYLPHFAGLRVDAKQGGNLKVKAVMTQQVAVSTGTVLDNGIVGTDQGAGTGNYFVYSISKDGGNTWTLPLWPSFTIEAKHGKPLNLEVKNELYDLTYEDVNITADQTVMMHGLPPTGDPMTEPYTGPIPICFHLHGGEVSSTSDGGPEAWFTPGYAITGNGWNNGVGPVLHYTNSQEAATLWYHEHSQPGLTRINVYSGMQGFYFLRGQDEERDKLPGWSKDDLVKEVTPNGRTPDVLHTGAYLPEIEIAIQDRMFDTKGELYYKVDEPPNPEIHPFWEPEFFGNIITVNGKTWPYLSVAPRKYRFRILNGAGARFFNLWLQNLSNGTKGPVIKQIGTDGGLLDSPVVIDPKYGKKLLLGCGERADVVVDFSGCASGTVLTLMNDAPTPYPDGDPVVTGTTDRIMQFVVNGKMVDNNHPNKKGKDKSQVPHDLRSKPMIKLSNFKGGMNINADVTRQLTLNEQSSENGPERVMLNNSVFMEMPGTEMFGEPTEKPVEGTVEKWQIINLTMDAHPIHMHLVQFQLVGRQEFDDMEYTEDYMSAFNGVNGGMPGMYMGAEGPPLLYDEPNSDGAIGGNLAITPYLEGCMNAPADNERGWKDVIIAYPGQITTYAVRFAPTDLRLNARHKDLVYGFDPAEGPGYVWHCHILEHEDNDMMRPMLVSSSPFRNTKDQLADLILAEPTKNAGLLEQNYPNPFTSTTTVPFNISENSKVKIDLYNSLGTKIRTLYEGEVPAGLNKISFSKGDLPGGIYFYRIQNGNSYAVKKMIVQ